MARPLLVFDLDGTLSLIRHGWQSVMAGVMTEALAESMPGRAGLPEFARTVVDATNGSPVVRQMEALSEQATASGGAAIDAPAWARVYQDRMQATMDSRKVSIPPESLLVPGAAIFVARARRAGFACALVSGSSAANVESDLAFLDLDAMFDGLVRSPLDPAAPNSFSKEQVFRDLMAECGVRSLVAFGDGPGEIRAAVASGGKGVGVAHTPGTGAIDAALSASLSKAGASLVVADFIDLRCWRAIGAI